MNKRLQIIKLILRIAAAGITAVAVLCVISRIFFDNPMTTACDNPAVDYSFVPDTGFSTTLEGWHYGTMNNEGLFNKEDFHEGDQVDLLLMGTSHIYGFVPLEETIASLANQIDPGLYTYSIGSNMHLLPTQIDNLEAAIERYHPGYVMLEFIGDTYTDKSFEDLLNGNVEDMPMVYQRRTKPFAAYYAPFMIQLRRNLKKLFKFEKSRTTAEKNREQLRVPQAREDVVSTEIMTEVLKLSKETADRYGVRLILLYHSDGDLIYPGFLSYERFSEERDAVKEACRMNQISFLDMTDDFLEHYNDEHHFAYGFLNTQPQHGHLNRYGNRMIAEQLISIIHSAGEH